jgi:hypothetical protein
MTIFQQVRDVTPTFSPRTLTSPRLRYIPIERRCAGIRSTVAVARQLVYEAEGLTVDLRLYRQPQSNKICVVGQVLDKGIPRLAQRRFHHDLDGKRTTHRLGQGKRIW